MSDQIPEITPKELRKLEAINARLKRRMGVAKISSYITPFPVSHFVPTLPEDGTVLRYMFPGGGSVSSACIYLEGEIKKGITLSANSVSTNGIGTGISAVIRKPFNKVGLDFKVSVGDRLEICLDPGEIEVTNIWTAFLWAPNVRDTDIKKFLRSEIDQLTDEE